MDIKKITDNFSVSGQITAADIAELKAQGIKSIIGNRPDGEENGQPTQAEIAEAAKAAGIEFAFVPVQSGNLTDNDVKAFHKALKNATAPTLAFCRSGTRSASIWALSEVKDRPIDEVLAQTKAAGLDLSILKTHLEDSSTSPKKSTDQHYDIVIVGAGASGIAVCSSLLARKADLHIALIDPADMHYYQPGWTMVGAGVFESRETVKTMASLIPGGVDWIKNSVVSFEPKTNQVLLDDNRAISYDRLIVSPGLKLHWAGIEGLEETLGRNGVTSNYRFDLAPYTWELVQNLNKGRAIFTQPPMPIKCAGAPQKAMYLSGDAWYRRGVLNDIDIQFMNAGGVLFGVKEYVPALEKYVEKYNANLNFFHNLTSIDGDAKKATFKIAKPDTEPSEVTVEFDMIHVVPPQTAPDFIKNSPLADAAGWVDVDQFSLRHKSYDNIWSLGDVMNAPNAKTAAAARKQAPVVAENIIADIHGKAAHAGYDGYGSCPLTVERGKIVLAEFGYGGALKPSFPSFVLDGRKPTRAAWFLKEKLLPPLYWQAMLRGKEWGAKPEKLKD